MRCIRSDVIYRFIIAYTYVHRIGSHVFEIYRYSINDTGTYTEKKE